MSDGGGNRTPEEGSPCKPLDAVSNLGRKLARFGRPVGRELTRRSRESRRSPLRSNHRPEAHRYSSGSSECPARPVATDTSTDPLSSKSCRNRQAKAASRWRTSDNPSRTGRGRGSGGTLTGDAVASRASHNGCSHASWCSSGGAAYWWYGRAALAEFQCEGPSSPRANAAVQRLDAD